MVLLLYCVHVSSCLCINVFVVCLCGVCCCVDLDKIYAQRMCLTEILCYWHRTQEWVNSFDSLYICFCTVNWQLVATYPGCPVDISCFLILLVWPSSYPYFCSSTLPEAATLISLVKSFLCVCRQKHRFSSWCHIQITPGCPAYEKARATNKIWNHNGGPHWGVRDCTSNGIQGKSPSRADDILLIRP